MKIKFVYFILFFCLVGLFIFSWANIYLPKEPLSQETKVFSIKKGGGTREISINLEKQGLIKSGPLFRIYTITLRIAGKLQAGNYFLSPAMTIPEIAEKLVSGDVIKEKITIIEGFDIKLIEEKFNEISNFQFLISNKFPISNFQTNNFKERFKFLESAPGEARLEGFLFPDTYEFSYGILEKEIIEKMLDNFDKKLTSDLREEIKKQGKTIFEIITMSSLLEKEVKTGPDKKLVSGILWKRMKSGMPLQVDATINYITGKKTNNVSFEETKIDSPYNTYKYKGLPMGPICNPGLESIIAAIEPQESEFWYYLSTPDGETIFSKTLEEHNIARVKYLK